MSIICAGHTRQCISRVHSNQDKFGSITVKNPVNEEVTLAVIADGISLGYEGKYASYNTVLRLLEWASEYLSSNAFDIQKIAREIQNQLTKCNHILNDFSDKHSDKDTCCTVCGMVTDQKQVLIFNAGDSRLYEISPYGQVRRMTQDDKAEDGYSISMHIGGKNDEEIRITFSADEFHTGNCYILCTDGFYKRCDFAGWAGYICGCRSRNDLTNMIGNISERLVNAGEADDITALILARSE